ncbi:MAG: SEL1-like repeat protein [Bacteroidales bacterium]|nr:SEL1-like repeat protein [Bacteroidales bacterium]
MKKLVFLLSLILCLGVATASAQQVTRGQVLKAMYKADSYHAAGKDSLAIALLDSMATLIPRLSVIYEREGRIYESMYEKQQSKSALNAAVLMYRRYLSLEMNENKTREVSQRLRDLEDKLQVAHFEDEEEALAQEEEKNARVLPVVTDDSQAADMAQNVVQPVVPPVEAPTVAPAIGKPGLEKQQVGQAEVLQPATLSPDLPQQSATQPQEQLASVKQEGGKFSYLTYYELEIPAKAVQTVDVDTKTLEVSDTEGHWVSSLANSDGRERWIFDISAFDGSCVIALHPQAGILNEPKGNRNFAQTVLNFMKDNDLIANTTLSIPCDQVIGTINGHQMVFNLESEKTYKPNASIYSWSHTLLDNVSTLLPFGQVIYKLGNSLLAKQESKDLETTYTTDAKFAVSKVSDGVLKVHYSAREKKTNKNGSKMMGNRIETFFLFRTTSDYVHFEPVDIEGMEDDHTGLFAQVSNDAQRDPSKLYALANMYFYGVGTETDESLGLQLMNKAAVQTNGTDAYAWLAKFYFNEAYEDQSLSSSSRKKYIKASNYNLGKLRSLQDARWYAIKGDMMENASGSEADSAFYFYQQGAMKGEPYALYKLGTCYVNANHTSRDLVRGLKFLNDAAEKGNAEAWLAIARMEKAGVGTNKDLDKYLMHLSKAIDMGSVEAIHELSDAYMQGIAVERDFHQASMIRESWYRAQQNNWIPAVIGAGYGL